MRLQFMYITTTGLDPLERIIEKSIEIANTFQFQEYLVNYKKIELDDLLS